MGDYKVAIKIAGQLEGSFNRTLKMAQSGIGGLAKIGKIGATAMAASAAAMGTLAAAGIKAGVEYEQAFAGVRKTVDATEAELQALSQGIRDMAKEMPTSASEIAGVAEAAGQLGIQTENILGFTKTMVMLGDATNMSADEAATSLARLANITGMPQSSFDRLGSTIVALGNNFATTESEITAMGLRIAGAGSQVGMTEAQIMSFSAALSSVGIEAEAGGSAFSKVLVDMQLATEKGGESLQQFANVAGMSASQFKQAFQTDAAGAMASFIKGLSESEAKGKSAIAVLDEMGITEVRMRDMLLRAAGASDTFTEALELGSAAWEENVALTNEANQRYKTMGSRLAILKNKAIDLGIAFYESVNTPMGDVVTAAGDMLENLNAAFESGGMSGLVNQLGTEIANAVTGIADAAPDMIDAAVDLMESFLAGIEQNQDKITSGLERTAIAAASGLIRITPQLVVVGAEFIVALAQGLVENAPQLAQAGREAVSYLMNAAKDAFREYVDFLGDDQVKPFEKILALIPAVAAGFGAFKVISTIAKDVTAFTNAIKGVGKATPVAKKGIGGVNSVMSATAKNILGAGVGLGMAAAGFWLLADAAIRLGEAGPLASIGMAVMAAGIAGAMVLITKFGPQLEASQKGLLAFGGAILMAAAGMSLMAFSATQLAAAGPMALVGLALMEAGIIGLLAVAGTMGTTLATATPGLLAFGGAILMAAVGMGLLTIAAMQLSSAGTGAILTLTGMGVGLMAFMAVAALLGPMLTSAAIGLVAFGAGVLLAATGMLLMTQAAIQLAAAGPTAQIAMALLAAGILAFGAVAGLLAPLLLAGAAALAAFGAALAVVGAAMMVVNMAAIMGAAALTLIAAVLPQLATHGMTGAAAIMALGASMTLFAAGALLAGAGAAAAAIGFTALAVAALAASVAFAPLAVEMAAIGAAIAIMATMGKTAADSMKSLKSSSKGMVTSMAKLAASLVAPTAALVPFAAAAVAASVPAAALAAALTLIVATITMLTAMVMAATMSLTMLNMTMVMFRTNATSMTSSATIIATAFTKMSAGIAPTATAMASLSGPTMQTAQGMMILSQALAMSVQTFTVMRMAIMTTAAAFTALVTAFAGAQEISAGVTMMSAAVSTGMTTVAASMATGMVQVTTNVRNGMMQSQAATTAGMVQIVAVSRSGMTTMVAVFRSGSVQIIAICRSTASGITSAFASVSLYSAGVNMMAGLQAGISARGASVIATARSIAQQAAAAVNSALQIHSPSRLMEDSGENVDNGLIRGMENNADKVKSVAVASLAAPVIDTNQNIRSIEAPQTTTARSAVIGETVNNLSEGKPGYKNQRNTDDTPPTFVFSPTYQFYGEAPSKDDIVEANRMSQAEFEKMMKEYLRKHKRVAFA